MMLSFWSDNYVVTVENGQIQAILGHISMQMDGMKMKKQYNMRAPIKIQYSIYKNAQHVFQSMHRTLTLRKKVSTEMKN